MSCRLILASASPARARLLKQAGLSFDIVATNIDEDVIKQQITDPETLVQTLAQLKANACLQQLPAPQTTTIIIGADTIVVCQGEIIGKPQDRSDAKRIIQKLSGKTHQVITGVCLLPQQQVFTDQSAVSVRAMTEQDIECYLDTNEWVSCAGGYQIQKTISRYITKIEGSYTNIIGLPIKKVKEVIKR